jgi:hypothetical protein
MPENGITYKSIDCNFKEVEDRINQLAALGWRVVTATNYGREDAVLIILEKR